MEATSIEVISENAKWACRGGIFIVMDSRCSQNDMQRLKAPTL